MADGTAATKKADSTKRSTSGFTAAERAAMKERSAELRSSGRKGEKKADEAQACLDKIAEMGPDDRSLAERIHAIVAEVAPDLDSKTWYGMPAYARDGKVICFFKPAEKFGARYATFGFSDVATLDDGHVWPTEYAVTRLTDADIVEFTKLIERATRH
ncbi:iron chaperone [Allobranchiibius sp. CTAmp26]|uniref:iron chaperone n=1 Tax=Allobranchiibius sp. CTAmp26 TaxID=2815214 RepID=UPI001AA188E8|nr:DUF1801 domain-containing protein [Allobranchiibius sp. CTAmp26]MBO1753938.1 DUF1801 domain-containing protein [Allobranchiibius sp. CTAmp26]